MKPIAIITARGGSKRIPKKNIKEFLGKPIIAYSIETAFESDIFDEVMVSTDSEEIAEIARKYGASVPFMRSAETSNDYANTSDVLKEVLNNYKEIGKVYSEFCCIYPTAPFITVDRLKEAYNLIEKGAHSVMTVTAFSFPPQRGLVKHGDEMIYREEKYRLTRSQDLETVYHDAGQFYFYKLIDNEFIDGDYQAVIIPEMEVQDIDNLSDWKIAELKYKLLKKEEVKRHV